MFHLCYISISMFRVLLSFLVEMSVNTASTPDGRGVLIYNGETILVYAQGVVLTLEKSGNRDLEGKRCGTLYLTSHRIIFMPDFSAHWLKSIEMPFSQLQAVNLEQPIFGANYLRGVLLALPGSQLHGEIPWRLTFNKGGCIDFGHSLLEAVDRASRSRPANAPPAYAPPSGDFYAAPPAYYAPNNGGANGFNAPTSVFPDRPDPNSVFMAEAPPPYPGIGAERPAQPTEELAVAGQTAAPPPYGTFTEGSGEGLRRRQH